MRPGSLSPGADASVVGESSWCSAWKPVGVSWRGCGEAACADRAGAVDRLPVWFAPVSVVGAVARSGRAPGSAGTVSAEAARCGDGDSAGVATSTGARPPCFGSPAPGCVDEPVAFGLPISRTGACVCPSLPVRWVETVAASVAPASRASPALAAALSGCEDCAPSGLVCPDGELDGALALVGSVVWVRLPRGVLSRAAGCLPGDGLAAWPASLSMAPPCPSCSTLASAWSKPGAASVARTSPCTRATLPSNWANPASPVPVLPCARSLVPTAGSAAAGAANHADKLGWPALLICPSPSCPCRRSICAWRSGSPTPRPAPASPSPGWLPRPPASSAA